MHRKLLQTIQHLLRDGEVANAVSNLRTKNFHTIAEIIDHLDRTWQRRVFSLLPVELQSEVIIALSEETRRHLLQQLSNKEVAVILEYNDEDDDADIMQHLSGKRRTAILTSVQENQRKKIEHLLTFGSETAGGLMDLNFIFIKPSFTFKDIADKVAKHFERNEQAPLIILTEDSGKVRGQIPYPSLIASKPTKHIEELAEPLPLFQSSIDQEELVKQVQHMKASVVGVVDESEKLIGIIHSEDLLKISQREATEDIYKFAGVRGAEEVTESLVAKVHKRYAWLIINLGTAFLASFVVSRFTDTISQIALLAVYMPMVAGEGGNAATQALAVAVRALAGHEITWKQARKIILREAGAGLMNGVIVGTIAAIITKLLGVPTMLAVVLGAAMIVNLLVAGFFGSLVPFVLKALKIDPATASSIFVTTATDVLGFLTFLGLGTALLL